ncbi:MAG: hypothetical protein DHS80DRAFT_13581, partial [Piptocephalis tieghemiana]
MSHWTRLQRRFATRFPELLEEVPYLLQSYLCALEREILWQGHVYITSTYFCFYSQILAKKIRVIVPLRLLMCLEKGKKFVFPNSIRITTADRQFTLTSFLKRDSCYLEMVRVWQ